MNNIQQKAIERLQDILDEAASTECAVWHVTQWDARALRMAIQALKEQENSIVLGRDYWSRYFEITKKEWRTEDGEYVDTSFCITKARKHERPGN